MGEKGTINSEGSKKKDRKKGRKSWEIRRSISGKKVSGIAPSFWFGRGPFIFPPLPPFDSPWGRGGGGGGGAKGKEFVFFSPCVLKEARPVGVFNQRANGRSKVVGLEMGLFITIYYNLVACFHSVYWND